VAGPLEIVVSGAVVSPPEGGAFLVPKVPDGSVSVERVPLVRRGLTAVASPMLMRPPPLFALA